MSTIIILGAGMVGSAMAIDMAKKHQVTVTDISLDRLERVRAKNPELETRQLDVRNSEALHMLLKPYDLVINAVPGFMGYETLRSVIHARKDVVDISFFPENALELDGMARENGVTAIIDCGVAPGMDNVILGYYNEIMKLTDFVCLVGGLPKVRKWPFYYKAPFSPVDVIEEYTRRARYVENGKQVVREPLTDTEYIDFEGVGTLVAFNSDGLRSLIFTMPHIPNMKEKTLRYPGHVEYINVLRSSGFFNTDPIEINGSLISPMEFTSRILFDNWKLGEAEEELTIMRVILKGENAEGVVEEVIYDMYDEYSPETGTSSMARTTGYTATAAANMVLEGLFREKGVFPPELVGRHKVCFDYFMRYLDERDIHYVRRSRLV